MQIKNYFVTLDEDILLYKDFKMAYDYSYEAFLSDCHILTQKIDWEFDTIIGVARGGLTLAHIFGEFYDIRKVYAINTIGYDETKKLASTQIFNIPEITNAQNILIVDDIVDSGETLELVTRTLSERYPNANFKTASLFYKESATIEPTWYAQHATDWIDFFWTTDLKKRSNG